MVGTVTDKVAQDYSDLVNFLRAENKQEFMEAVQVLMKDNITMYQQIEELLNGKQGSSEKGREQASPGDDK